MTIWELLYKKNRALFRMTACARSYSVLMLDPGTVYPTDLQQRAPDVEIIRYKIFFSL